MHSSRQVYQRGVSAIPLSVELWLSYLALFKDQYIKKDDPERDQKIRQYLFSFCFIIEPCILLSFC